jgi:hypothetical protein
MRWSPRRTANGNLSDTQVIVYSRWDRSPDLVEDQVTYPIVSAMLGAPKAKTVCGCSAPPTSENGLLKDVAILSGGCPHQYRSLLSGRQSA